MNEEPRRPALETDDRDDLKEASRWLQNVMVPRGLTGRPGFPAQNQSVIPHWFVTQLDHEGTAWWFLRQMGVLTFRVESARRFAGQLKPSHRAEFLASQLDAVFHDVEWFAGQLDQSESAKWYVSQLDRVSDHVVSAWAKYLAASPFVEVGTLLAMESVPSKLRTVSMAKVLESVKHEYRPLDEAKAALADWARERITGAETASPERFEEIAGSLITIELDEETERQLDHLARDETALRYIANYWGLERLSLNGRSTIIALLLLAGFTASALLLAGMMAAPEQTEIIARSISGGAVTTGTLYGLVVKFSPKARAQLDAMKPTDPDAGKDDGAPAASAH